MQRTIASLALNVTMFLALAPIGWAQQSPPSIPAVTEAMQAFVEQGEIAGAVTVITDPSTVVHASAVGKANLQDGQPMRIDSIFWIASMSKPVTATAVMMLVEEGKLSLDDKIATYLPAMKQLQTKDGQAAEITIRQLLSHTSGMAELPRGEAYSPATLAEVVEKYADVEILFPPGSEWRYSQTSINTAARIVEVVSGKSFDQFLQQRVFDPLGMVDTSFYLSEDQHQRLAVSYRKGPEGQLLKAPVMILQGKSPTSRDRFPAGNGGLFSTAPDYARFCQMLLGEGETDGVRLLKPESVRTMRRIVTGDLVTGFTPGNGWGIGVCVVREPQGITMVLSPGSFGHGGVYGTQAWIDPVKQRAYVLMIQRSDLPNSDKSRIRQDFQNAADKALSHQPSP